MHIAPICIICLRVLDSLLHCMTSSLIEVLAACAQHCCILQVFTFCFTAYSRFPLNAVRQFPPVQHALHTTQCFGSIFIESGS